MLYFVCQEKRKDNKIIQVKFIFVYFNLTIEVQSTKCTAAIAVPRSQQFQKLR